jgi:flagella basal body P-ring formation protein FlgA
MTPYSTPLKDALFRAPVRVSRTAILSVRDARGTVFQRADRGSIISAGLLVAAVAALLPAMPAAGQGDTAALRVELQGEAVAAGALVRLGDVALIDGPGGEALRSLAVCPAPAAGGELTLPADRVRRRVMAALGSAAFTLAGPDACRIRSERAAEPVVSGPSQQTGEPAGAALADILRDYVTSRLDLASSRIVFAPRDDDVLGLDDRRWQFRLHSATGRVTAGEASVRVEVFDRSDPRLAVRSAVVRFAVVAIADVVVATRSFRAGHVIGDQDVRVERREFRDLPRMLVSDLADVLGTTSRGNVEAGQMIRVEDLKETLLVRRGNAVTVYALGRGFRIKTVARALESGELGSAVAVEGLDGQGKFYGTVIGPRTVEVRLAGAPAALASVATGHEEGSRQ